jgi:penicillin-binding protein 1B
LQRAELVLEQALDPGAAFLTSYLMTQVVERGTARQLQKLLPASLRLAGKTGTTNDSRDSWFVGYDDQLLAVTWLGRDDYRPTPFTGATGAMQLWVALMQQQPLHSLNLAGSDLIEWQTDTELPYAGECLQLEAVPYLRGHPPELSLGCDGESEPRPSLFNPLRWFQ